MGIEYPRAQAVASTYPRKRNPPLRLESHTLLLPVAPLSEVVCNKHWVLRSSPHTIASDLKLRFIGRKESWVTVVIDGEDMRHWCEGAAAVLDME